MNKNHGKRKRNTYNDQVKNAKNGFITTTIEDTNG